LIVKELVIMRKHITDSSQVCLWSTFGQMHSTEKNSFNLVKLSQLYSLNFATS